jgi:V/A-type H+-transporting ATPase subunit A
LYVENFADFWKNEIAPDFAANRATALTLLEQESKLLEIVRLVGMESLSASDRLILEVSRMIREDFLFQDAFDPEDAYTPLKNQYGLLKSIIVFYEAGKDVVITPDFDFATFSAMPIIAEYQQLKNNRKATAEEYEAYQARVREEINALVK